MMTEEIYIETKNPEMLDQTIQHFGGILEQEPSGDYVNYDGAYKARCLGDINFLKFAIENQGYGRIVKR